MAEFRQSRAGVRGPFGWTSAAIMAAVLALGGLVAHAQTPRTAAPAARSAAPTNNAHAEAVELLRKVIQEQQQHPDRIIRTPSANSAGREVKAAPAAASVPRPNRAELERQFLEGKMSAKQFQRAVEDLEKNPPPPAPAEAATAVTKGGSKEPALSPKAAASLPGKVVTNQPVTVVTSPEDSPEHKTLTDVEAKIDEILSRRQAQLDAAKTNSPATAAPTGPLTKRQQLDALLRSLIQGKITDAEYNAQREKVMALPE